MATQTIKVKLVLLSFMLIIFVTAADGMAGDTTGITDNEIRVGLFHSITGPASVVGLPQSQGQHLIFNLTNEAGGVYGRKIKVFVEDDANNPERAKSAVKKHIYDNKVFLLSGSSSSLGTFAVKKEIEEAKIPWLAGPAAADKIFFPPVATTFGCTLTTGPTGRIMAGFILGKADVKKIAFVYHYDDWGKANLDPTVKEIEKFKERNVEWVAEVIDRGATDASAVVLNVRKFNPDAVIAILYPQEATVFIRDAHKYGLKIPIMCTPTVMNLRDLAMRIAIPEAVKWVFAIAPSTWCESTASEPKYSYLAAGLKKYFPETRILNYHSLGFGYGQVIVEALRRAGRNLTREKFLDSFYTIRDFDTGAGKASYSKADHSGVQIPVIVTLRKDGIEYFLDKIAWDPDIMRKKNWE